MSDARMTARRKGVSMRLGSAVDEIMGALESAQGYLHRSDLCFLSMDDDYPVSLRHDIDSNFSVESGQFGTAAALDLLLADAMIVCRRLRQLTKDPSYVARLVSESGEE